MSDGNWMKLKVLSDIIILGRLGVFYKTVFRI